MSLLKKSEQNFEISEFAEKKQYYDVATSRLYYSCFQKVLYFFEKKGLNIENEVKKQEGSHNSTIKLMKNYINLFHSSYIAAIAHLEDLKRSRTIADYDKKIIKKSDYKELKENFLEIDEVLNELLNEGWGWKWKTR